MNGNFGVPPPTRLVNNQDMLHCCSHDQPQAPYCRSERRNRLRDGAEFRGPRFRFLRRAACGEHHFTTRVPIVHQAAMLRPASSPSFRRVPARLFWSRLVDWSQGRTLVGQDDVGRKYYVAREDRPRVSSAVERRTFDGDADVELPAEWLAWLRHTRAEPPTPEESKQLADAREERRRRVEALQLQEQQRKTRARVQGTQTGEGAGAEQLGDAGRSTRDWQPDKWQ